MDSFLHTDKTQVKTYRHYNLQPGALATEPKKLEFFYVGKTGAVIDALIRTFDSGYAAENADNARGMLRRVMLQTGSIPDVIILDSGLGHHTLVQFSQYIVSQKALNSVPVIIEGSSLAETDLEKFRTDVVAEDIVSVNDLSPDKLGSKIRFWKNVKMRINEVQEPVKDDFAPVRNYVAEYSKRAFDIVISLSLIIALSPLFLLIALAMKLDSKGPVFYISKRAGRGYKIFKFYKFRTMEVEANKKISDFSHLNIYNPLKADGPVFIKIDNDPRITKLGAFLRKCSLDELPQLWNVFLGDMSLVGNRPLPLYEAATLTTDEWAKRFMAPAGMTGLWQIKKKSRATMTAEERINLDINYADNSNFLFDLWIMANTPYAVIQRTNA